MVTAPRQRQPRSIASTSGESNTSISTSQNTTPNRRWRRSRRKRDLGLGIVVAAISVSLALLLVLLQRSVVVVVVETPAKENDRKPLKTSKIERPIETAVAERPILTAYLEPRDTLHSNTRPLPPRSTSADRLTKVQYPQVLDCSRIAETWPINEFPSEDPFLPWIHDVFVNHNETAVTLIAQNKRKCSVGLGKEEKMQHWEPQISLLQPVPVYQQENGQYRLSSPAEAMWKET